MTIWELTVEFGYNIAKLVDENGNLYYDNSSDYTDIGDKNNIRKIQIEETKKGFSDIMAYSGIGGAFVIDSKLKSILEESFSSLSMQFYPCYCERFSDIGLWVLNICEYHDVLDIPNCIYRTGQNIGGNEVIMNIKKYAFKSSAFGSDCFKIYQNGEKNCFHLFVSDRFKTIMEENEVTGLNLKAVYSV